VQGRVNFEIPVNSYYIAELDVDAPLRNRGIGGMLLRHAEVLARGHGCTRLSLTTTITNPARHLYDRHGYAVAGEKRDVEYERITGVPGRVFMVKDLQPV
jgi:ribosomal protein S18 acetylase RimI-like enzyme